MRNSLYKDPDAQAYREQVCSLIDILKRDKFTQRFKNNTEKLSSSVCRKNTNKEIKKKR